VDDVLRRELVELTRMAKELCEWEVSIGSSVIPLGAVPEAKPAPAPRPIEAQPEVPRAPEPPRSVVAPSVPAPPLEERLAQLRVLADEAAACTRCTLHETRTRSVFARGSADAELMFVGEGPGFNEDKQGLPFVGKAGQLLDKMIGAMGYERDAVYICNVVKCRPPDNRTPLPDEAGACRSFLLGQLEAVSPRVIVALGRCAAENLGCLDDSPRGWRGRWSTFEGIPVMATYHPAFLLRNPDQKRPVWQDLQAALARLGRAAPGARA
jgi:DNA polymerase